MIDQQDRRILGTAIVLLLAFVLTVLTLAATLGAGVRVFLIVAGLGG